MAKTKSAKQAAASAETTTNLHRTHRLFGWTALLIWLLFGTLLEAMHGFKMGGYLLDELRREFWSLAHFHGATLAVVNLIYVRWAEAEEIPQARRILASRLLIVGSLLMPVGFFLGGLWHFEGDPGIGVFLAPPGALAILGTVLIQTMAAWDE